MNPRWKNFFIAFGGCIAAMILGGFLVDENYTFVVVGLAVAAFCGAFYRVLWKGVLLEAVVLGCLLFGYVVGESGFGHLHLGESVYFGEVGLAACVLIFGVRVAFTKERFIHRDPLSLAVCGFVFIGTLRYLADLISASGNTKDQLTITRDFAAVYYAFFFFIAANISLHERTRRYLEKVLPVAIVCLLPVAIVTVIYPEIWDKLTYHEQAAIYVRWDLAGSFLGFGAIYFMLSREGRGYWLLRTFVSFLCFGFVMTMNARSDILGLGLAVVILLVARKLRIVRDFALFAVLGVIALGVFHSVRPKQDNEITTSQFADKILSIFDLGSSGSYSTDYGSMKSGNNHFRVVWWTSVYNETVENNPAFGLGFGYDLAKRFIETYDYEIDRDDFRARSPHSILVSTFGRMGFVGLASFLLVVFLMFRGALRCAVAVRKKEVPAVDLSAWCGAIIIFVAACLTVMLEGPMAAIVFWSLLGMATCRQTLRAKADQEPALAKSIPINLHSPRPPLVTAGYR